MNQICVREKENLKKENEKNKRKSSESLVWIRSLAFIFKEYETNYRDLCYKFERQKFHERIFHPIADTQVDCKTWMKLNANICDSKYLRFW